MSRRKTKSPTPTASPIPAQGNALGSPTQSAPDPVRVAQLTDEQFSCLQRTINCSIHELVFALHYLEDDQLEESMDRLTTVGLNVDSVQQTILCLQKERGEV